MIQVTKRRVALLLMVGVVGAGTFMVARSTPRDSSPISANEIMRKLGFESGVAGLSGRLGSSAERRMPFSMFLAADSKYKCVGWHGNFKSTTPNANGWEAVIEVRPRLTLRSGGGVVFTPMTQIETWQVDRSGEVWLKSAEPGPGPAYVFVD